jgi:hypothetical protein
MVKSERQRKLGQYRREFYAHNTAASKAVSNETNDTPQDVRQDQQRKHSSFEAGPSGRLNVSSTYYTVPNSSGKRCRGESEIIPQTSEINFTDLDEFSDNFAGMFEPMDPSTKQKHSFMQGEALRMWQSDADAFLEEFLRLDGRGDYVKDQCTCGRQGAIYRCQDCHGCELLCHECMIHIHDRQPLHQMEVCALLIITSLTSTESFTLKISVGTGLVSTRLP